ncbi:hypothetical protein AKJ16_DCAP12057 [Drosera capensis]
MGKTPKATAYVSSPKSQPPQMSKTSLSSQPLEMDDHCNSGIILMGPTMDMSCGAAACPLYCLEVDYATCSSSGDEQRSASCNCCLSGLTGSGCVLHLTGGGTITC